VPCSPRELIAPGGRAKELRTRNLKPETETQCPVEPPSIAAKAQASAS
jgi:hypothetical protein